MGKRIITLGTWEGKPIEWIVLKEDSFGKLAICKERIGTFRFNDNSSNNNWGSSSLRKYLNGEFFNNAFSDDEKKKIVNSSLDSTKDDVFILTKNEITELLLKDGTDPYESSHYNNCSYCCWTRSKNGSYVDNGYARGCWCSHSSSSTYSVRPAIYIRDCKYSAFIDSESSSSVNSSCVLAGTQILMENGTTKLVENITTGDRILTWNFETGGYQTVPIICNVHSNEKEKNAEIIHLSFSDGTIVDVVNEHGFFDVDLAKYVYLDRNASCFIGHSFFKYSKSGTWTTAKLIDVSIERKNVKAFCPVSYGEISFFTNGLLSIPGDCFGIFNIFEVNVTTMTIKEDIKKNDIIKYGLYSYEDLQEYVSENVFLALNAKYWKVSVEKHLMEYSEVVRLLTTYNSELSAWDHHIASIEENL